MTGLPTNVGAPPGEWLRHHGDVDAEPGLLDFAVNVALPRPPSWLRDVLVDGIDRLAAYPSSAADLAARTAVADRHGRRVDEVLVLAGAAEGFALLPNLTPKLAAVVHPSFTEPEVALRTAGVPVHRVLLRADDGFRLRTDDVPAAADLVVLGNPTNPTSVLHPADVITALARPGRVLVVDEAFADTVSGEPQSVASQRIHGVIVLRSLTKTFALAGLRAGYALGAPPLLRRLAVTRPHWPVSSLVLAAVRACNQPNAIAETLALARKIADDRRWLIAALDELRGVEVHTPAAAPFLLLRVPNGPVVRKSLRANGIAVRRADTFPGLTDDHLRVAVRPREQAAALVRALEEAVNG